MNRDTLTKKIIGAAIEVHRILGPGLLESIYEQALCHEFSQQGSTAQVLSYLKASGLKRALLINFGEKRLIDGVKRLSL